jgi:hypothetical protein
MTLKARFVRCLMVQNRTAIFADHFIFDHGTDATYQQQWDAL